ncbi:hypothetical protein CBOM_07427 [Ceraceosorus bombacis]|uniref:Uncharacterized protein n=1 Tax=Ceraceosorus bombacis TaxID=401625 RepID=A0A0P1BAF9_9BASI|nr:hypothetical protein CBOM_07427 [Ceraceosorus bombacis]
MWYITSEIRGGDYILQATRYIRSEEEVSCRNIGPVYIVEARCVGHSSTKIVFGEERRVGSKGIQSQFCRQRRLTNVLRHLAGCFTTIVHVKVFQKREFPWPPLRLQIAIRSLLSQRLTGIALEN